MEKIAGVEVAPDGRRAMIQLNSWREDYVYELRIKSLVEEDKEFFPSEAHFTLRKAPLSN